jgi:integrase
MWGHDYDVIVKLLVLSGQRREEVGGMRWSELGLDRALWSLPPERTNNKRPHNVPLAELVVMYLKARREIQARAKRSRATRGLPRVPERDLVFGEGDGPFSGWSRCKARLNARVGPR